MEKHALRLEGVECILLSCPESIRVFLSSSLTCSLSFYRKGCNVSPVRYCENRGNRRYFSNFSILIERNVNGGKSIRIHEADGDCEDERTGKGFDGRVTNPEMMLANLKYV